MDDPRAGLRCADRLGDRPPKRESSASRWSHFSSNGSLPVSHSTEGPMLNLDQFMNIRFLRRQGHSVRAIARMTGHARNTVRKLLRMTRAPVAPPRVPHDETRGRLDAARKTRA